MAAVAAVVPPVFDDPLDVALPVGLVTPALPALPVIVANELATLEALLSAELDTLAYLLEAASPTLDAAAAPAALRDEATARRLLVSVPAAVMAALAALRTVPAAALPAASAALAA